MGEHVGVQACDHLVQCNTECLLPTQDRWKQVATTHQGQEIAHGAQDNSWKNYLVTMYMFKELMKDRNCTGRDTRIRIAEPLEAHICFISLDKI